MQEPRRTPHPVLVIESFSRQTVCVSDNGCKVANMVGGVIPLRNQDVPKNERCATIAHCQKLAAQELKSLFTLDVVVVGQSDIIRLKPIASFKGRRISIDICAISTLLGADRDDDHGAF